MCRKPTICTWLKLKILCICAHQNSDMVIGKQSAPSRSGLWHCKAKNTAFCDTPFPGLRCSIKYVLFCYKWMCKWMFPLQLSVASKLSFPVSRVHKNTPHLFLIHHQDVNDATGTGPKYRIKVSCGEFVTLTRRFNEKLKTVETVWRSQPSLFSCFMDWAVKTSSALREIPDMDIYQNKCWDFGFYLHLRSCG